MKKRRTGKDAEPSMKSLKSKESAKGKNPSNTSKTSKCVSADKSVHKPKYVLLMDVEKPNLDNVDNDADEPQVDATPKIPKQDCVQIEKKSGYGNLEEIVLRRADQKLYKFKKGDMIVDFVTALKMFTRRIIVQNRVEDVQLGVESYRRKLNLTMPQGTCLLISTKEPYTPNFDPSGVIYEDKIKKKRLMCVDEVNKFCDGTLQSVCNILCQRLQNFKIGYNNDMPLRQWINKDKRCTCIKLTRLMISCSKEGL
nr:hypothetical protein [Tanacetum cinerariifolium]